MSRIFIGTAGWSIPRASSERCTGPGTHLQRYARRLRAAEINTTFYRSHELRTYTRWAGATGPSFRFAIKVPRVITHELKLRRASAPLEQFLDESAALGRKRGPILIQLPPSLEFDGRTVTAFLRMLRDRHDGLVVCEPRHPSWLLPEVEDVLRRYEIGRVGADPPPAPGADRPGGWPGIVYYRLHGSPRKYWSTYDASFLDALAADLRRVPPRVPAWCIFDNTASGGAIENALDLAVRLDSSAGVR
jgi:uncharacterized protein YecE (DUF72 family)